MIFVQFFLIINLITQTMIRKNIRSINLFFSAVLIISLVSCDPSKKLTREEDDMIQDYLSQHSNLNFVLKASGLYYLEVVSGTGLTPVISDSAFVRYTGKFLDGTVFDSNVGAGQPLYAFTVGQNITGFDEGIMLMKADGKSTLLIPSELGYGTYGSPPYIQGYTPLLFDIELIKVVPHSVK